MNRDRSPIGDSLDTRDGIDIILEDSLGALSRVAEALVDQ